MSLPAIARPRFALAVILALSLTVFAASTARAQGGASASIDVDTSTGQFICTAGGIETTPPGSAGWYWIVYIDGTEVDDAFYSPIAPGTMVPIDLDLYEPPAGGLTGEHTCRFFGAPLGGYGDGPWWNVTKTYDFP